MRFLIMVRSYFIEFCKFNWAFSKERMPKRFVFGNKQDVAFPSDSFRDRYGWIVVLSLLCKNKVRFRYEI